MTGEQWVNSFIKSLVDLKTQSNIQTDPEWTKFMVKVMVAMEEKVNCYVYSKYSNRKEWSGEYLSIDAMFIDRSAYNNWDSKEWDPPVLPSAVVELENDDRFGKITYCLWKILCIRAEVRVLICYQKDKSNIVSLKRHLEKTIKDRKLIEEDKGDLLVIVGDKSKDNIEWKDYGNIKDYFSIFRWQNERLEDFSPP